MGKVKVTRSPVRWFRLFLFAGCLLLGLLLLHIAVVPPGLEWLVWGKWGLCVLLFLSVALLVLLEISPLFFRRKCASCGGIVYHDVPYYDPCPQCDRPFGDVAKLMPQGGNLDIREYFSDSRPMAKAMGLIVGLAIRDGVNEVRFVGRHGDDDPEVPPDKPHCLWRIWYHLKDGSYEMIPPPRHVGTAIFLMLKEIRRNVQQESDAGPVCFRIVFGDYSEPVDLVLEESEKENAARIVFTSDSLDPCAEAGGYLKSLFERRRSDRTLSVSNDCA